MVRPRRCLLIFSLVKMNKFFSLTHLCTLWRRSKPLIKPPQEFASYTGLSATFRALSRDKWAEPGFFSRRFFFWWLVVSPFPFGSFCSEQICKGYEVIFPNSSLILILEYITVVSFSEEPSKISPTLKSGLLAQLVEAPFREARVRIPWKYEFSFRILSFYSWVNCSSTTRIIAQCFLLYALF